MDIKYNEIVELQKEISNKCSKILILSNRVKEKESIINEETKKNKVAERIG